MNQRIHDLCLVDTLWPISVTNKVQLIALLVSSPLVPILLSSPRLKALSAWLGLGHGARRTNSDGVLLLCRLSCLLTQRGLTAGAVRRPQAILPSAADHRPAFCLRL